jgi:hypothetical protein
MKRVAIVVVIVALLAAIGSALRAQGIYRSLTDVVVIDVAVNDGKKPVPSLTKDDFEVRDNGVAQRVLDVSRESMPLDMTLTIDVSGSMTREDREIVQRAVGQLSTALDTGDRVRVMTFATLTAERTPLASPPINVDLSHVGPGTAVFDALLLSIVTPPMIDRRQIVLFMTDGQDTTSSFDGATVVETAKHASAPTTIVLVPNRAPNPVRGLLHSVAAQTGGEVVELKGHDQLNQAFLTALQNFKTSYLVRYSPTGVSKTGWHDVAVRIKSKSYQVRARRGYWADSSVKSSSPK